MLSPAAVVRLAGPVRSGTLPQPGMVDSEQVRAEVALEALLELLLELASVIRPPLRATDLPAIFLRAASGVVRDADADGEPMILLVALRARGR